MHIIVSPQATNGITFDRLGQDRKALRRHNLAVTAAELFDLSEHEAHADARDGLTHRQPVQASHAAIRS